LIDAVNHAIGSVFTGTQGLVVTAASNTPGLKEIVITKVHRSGLDECSAHCMLT
jgi:hypothetical protein